ncbi:hypothetical protein [Homoserinimonas aerilata]|nr:hypothetical protein [Homoserinimonas aerilata]
MQLKNYIAEEVKRGATVDDIAAELDLSRDFIERALDAEPLFLIG